jgi:hypothetical protein
MLSTMNRQDMHHQRQALETFLAKHQANAEQWDDMTVAGIRLSS